jgi:hypothetical protein
VGLHNDIKTKEIEEKKVEAPETQSRIKHYPDHYTRVPKLMRRSKSRLDKYKTGSEKIMA